MKIHFSHTVYGVDLRCYTGVCTVRKAVEIAGDVERLTFSTLAGQLPLGVHSPEPTIQANRNGVYVGLYFSFPADSYRFDAAARQNVLVIDPTKAAVLVALRACDSFTETTPR